MIIQSQTVRLLKALLTLLVVALHTSMAADLDYTHSPEHFARVVICQLGQVAVPVFFFFSGYYFFSKMNEWNLNVWKTKMAKRMRTLFIPYLGWIIIAFFAWFLFSLLKGEYNFTYNDFVLYIESKGGWRLLYDRPVIDSSTNVFGYMVHNDKPIDSPLWYLRDLFLVILLSPLLWKFIKQFGKWGLLPLMLFYFLNIWIPFSGLSITAVFFFTSGAYFSILSKQFHGVFIRMGNFSFLLSSILLIGMMITTKWHMQYHDYLTRIFVILFGIACYKFAYFLSQKGVKLKLIQRSSFFIYAVHAVVILELSNLILWHTLPFDNQLVLFLKLFLRPLLGVFISVCLYLFMKKYLNLLLNILTGGRTN